MQYLIKRTILTASTVLLALGTGKAVEAATFDFRSQFESSKPSYTFMKDGVSLDVTGGNLIGSLFGTQLDVNQSEFGLGVGTSTNPVNGTALPFPVLFGEMLFLKFSKPVFAHTLHFNGADADDRLLLFTGNNFSLSSITPKFSFNNSSPISKLGIMALGPNSEFYVEGIDFEVEEVPEPLSIFGTATALGFGAFFQSKKAKKRTQGNA